MKKVFISFLILLITYISKSQSPIISLPPNSVTNPPPLATPLPTAPSNAGAIVYNGPPHPTQIIDNYQGGVSQFAHNAY